MGDGRRFRGDRFDPRSFDWLRAAERVGVGRAAAEALWDEAVWRAAYPASPDAATLYLSWLEDVEAPTAPEVGKRTLTMLGARRPRVDHAIDPGRRTRADELGHGDPGPDRRAGTSEDAVRASSSTSAAAVAVFRHAAAFDGVDLDVVPDIVDEVLASSGAALDEELREFFEAQLTADFGHVRIIQGEQASASARAIGARAYAVGSKIVIGDVPFMLASAEGKRLLAHELTHVMQQAGAAPDVGRRIAPADDPREAEADAVADAVAAGRAPRRPTAGAAAGTVHLDRTRDGRTPLQIQASTFQEAARDVARRLREVGLTGSRRIVVINGLNVRVFDESGNAVGSGRAYRLVSPQPMPNGVFEMVPSQTGRRLRIVLIDAQGRYSNGGVVSAPIDFSRHIDDQAAFDTDVAGGPPTYVVPTAAVADAADGPPPPPPEPRPEFMQFAATGHADLEAWPAAVVPLTPQVTAVSSTGSFLCHLEKTAGSTLLERTTNVMQPMAFRWEVLRLERSLEVVSTTETTRGDAALAGFRRRERHLQEDRAVWLGAHPERQPVIQRAIRQELADYVTQQRRALAMTGQVALTIIHAITAGTGSPNVDDVIDVTFSEPGDYFVRCLATPIQDADAPHRRATSVAGAMVSVFDAAALAQESVGTEESDRATFERALARDETAVQGLRDQLAEVDMSSPSGRQQATALRAMIRMGELALEHDRARLAATDETARQQAELDWARARIAYLTGPDAPRDSSEARGWVADQLREIRARERELAGLFERADERLGSDMTRTALMPAVLVADDSGQQIPLTFSIGERTYLNNDEIEVTIADVTAEHGRVFNGRAPGRDGRGREAAWNTALADLRRNLGRGRGWLGMRIPPPYAALAQHQPNPMQLQVGPLDQVHEAVDDSVHAATLVALLAAPLTGGASLGVLAVLAPISAGSSLYRLVNRAMYGDLHLDADAISGFIDVATLGLGRVGTAGRFASRGVQMVATSARVALQLLDRGQYVVLAWTTYQEIMAEIPGETEAQRRARILRALLSALEGVAIPVASHMWPGGAHDTARRPDGHPPVGPEDAPGTTSPHLHPTPTGPALPPSPELQAALGRFQGDVHMEVVPGMGDAVHVEYDPDFRGGIAEIRVRVGEHARPADVAGHVPTIATLARYRGFLGRVRTLLEQLRGWITNHGEPPLGTRAWEARHELEKLPRLVSERVRRLRDAGPLEREGLLDEIAALEEQIQTHAQTLDEMDLDPGVGFIAMGRTRRRGGGAELPGNWRQRLDALDEHLAASGRDGQERETRAAAAAELARLRAQHPDPEQLYRSLMARDGWDPANPAELTGRLAQSARGRLQARSTLGAAGSEFGRMVGAVHAAAQRRLATFEQFIASRDAFELFGDARHWEPADREPLARAFQEATAAAADLLAHAEALRARTPASAPATAEGAAQPWTPAQLAHHFMREWAESPAVAIADVQARMDAWVTHREGGAPFGFRDEAHFNEFRQALADSVHGLRRGRDAELFLQGSAVTGFSFESQVPFGGHSDFDVAVVSRDLFAEAERRGFEVLGNPRHIGPLTHEQAVELGLDRAASAGATVLGAEMNREINFMLFDNRRNVFRPIGQSRETSRASRRLDS